jgi:RNA polymerase sigma-70 factor (ECF subfamily)
MEQAPATRASLLLRIRDGQDLDAWRQFVQLYAPIVYSFARKRGLQDADAADLMQEVLRSVAGAAGRLDYDPKRGTFRSWLYTVTRNKLYSFLNGQRRHVRGGGGSGAQSRLEEVAEPGDAAAQLWDQEYERRVFAWAVEQVRGEFSLPTWQAFWQTAVEGKNPKEVAAALGTSPGAVYVSKSRVLARLRECVQQLQEE